MSTIKISSHFPTKRVTANSYPFYADSSTHFLRNLTQKVWRRSFALPLSVRLREYFINYFMNVNEWGRRFRWWVFLQRFLWLSRFHFSSRFRQQVVHHQMRWNERRIVRQQQQGQRVPVRVSPLELLFKKTITRLSLPRIPPLVQRHKSTYVNTYSYITSTLPWGV
jgi:hypothetical protein